MTIGLTFREREMQEQVQDSTPTNTEPSEAFYADAVRKGKDANAVITSKQWILGDLTADVTKVYGENRLERYAKDINFAGSPCTLGRNRSVCAAFPKTGARPRFFASAKILAPHPDRIAIVERNPTISKAEAHELMSKWRAEQNGTAAPTEVDEIDDDLEEVDTDQEEMDTEPTATAETDTESTAAPTSSPAKAKGAKGAKKAIDEEQARLKETRRVCNIFFDLVNAMHDAAADVMKEAQSDLLKVAEPRLVKDARKRFEEVTMDLFDPLDQLFAEAADKLEQEGSVRTSPKPAGEARQAGV
jgi:hypothetical protein